MLDGNFVAPLAPTSFYPLIAGIGSPEEHAALVERYLRATDKFGGAFGLPSVTRDDPAYGDNVYWRGRIWGPLNFWTYQGLRRAGLDGEAAGKALDSDAYQREVDAKATGWSRQGVSGVPFFVVHPASGAGQPVAFSGAQPCEVIAEVLAEQAAA